MALSHVRFQQLLEKRYAESIASPTAASLDEQIFTLAIALLEPLDCIWCRYDRVAGELFRLINHNTESEYWRWFCRKTVESLAKCVSCIERYYLIRSSLREEFAKLLQREDFWGKVQLFDVQRLSKVLRDFTSGRIDYHSSLLVHSLYEILLYPRLCDGTSLYGLFVEIVERLIKNKKMLLVNKIIPGLLVAFLDDASPLRNWATSVLSKEDGLEKGVFPEDAINMDSVLKKIRLDNLEEYSRVIKLLRWGELIPASFMQSFIGLLQKSQYFGSFPSGTLSIILPLQCLDQTSFKKIAHKTLLSSRHTSEIASLRDFLLWKNELLVIEYLLRRVTGLDNHLTAYLVENFKEFFSLEMLCLCAKQMSHTFAAFIKSMHTMVSNPVLGSASQITILQILILADISAAKFDIEIEAYDYLRDIPPPTFFSELCDDKLNNSALIIKYLLRKRIRKRYASQVFCDAIIVGERLNNVNPALLLFLAIISENSNHHVLLANYFFSHPELAINALANFSLILSNNLPFPKDMYVNLANFLGHYLDRFIVSEREHGDKTIIDLFPQKEEMLKSLCKSLYDLLFLPLLIVPAYEPSELIEAVCAMLMTIDKISTRWARKIQLDKQHVRMLLLSTFSFFKGTITQVNLKMQVKILIVLVKIAIFSQFILDWELLELLKGVLSRFQGIDLKLLDELDRVLDDYETKTRLVLPRPPRGKIPSSKPAKSKLELNSDLEAIILDDIQSAASRRQEQALPISLRSKHITLASKSTSKLDQIRLEAAQEVASIPISRNLKPSMAVADSRKRNNNNHGSSESESEGWEDPLTLKSKLPATIGKPFVATDTFASRSIKMIDFDETTKIKPQKSAKPIADWQDEVSLLKKFHRKILGFGFSSENQPNEPEALTPVPLAFSSVGEYVAVFEPLLFTECHAQLQTNFEEAIREPPESLRVIGVAHMDEFHEIQVCDERAGEKKSDRLIEHDYILAYLGDALPIPAVVAHTLNKGGTSEAIIRLLLNDEKRFHLQLELREGMEFKLRYLGSVVTNFREYVALCSFASVSMNEWLLQPNLPALATNNQLDSVAENLSASIKINKSQAKAVVAVTENHSPIVLIQGPPGTGKTRTIEAILGNLSGRTPEKKILVCAPSNAAIDEIVRRIRYGLCNAQGVRANVRIIRVGTTDMIADDVKDLTVECQVDMRMKVSALASSKLLEEQKKNNEDLRRTIDDLEKSGDDPDRLRYLKTKLWEAKEAMRKNQKYLDDTRSNIRQKILEEAQIVCCTLSSSGHDMISRLDFETVIIDEACQAVELSCLVPLRHNARKLVLVGDPNQLPPTVISQVAEVFSYEQSLFVRIQKSCPQSILLLDTQYRMHPEISRFPNNYFYNGRLVDGPSMAEITRRPWHAHKLLGPFKFMDIQGREVSLSSGTGLQSKSKLNEAEAQVAANLVALICSTTKASMANKIGIVTPYKDQRRMLRRVFQNRFGNAVLNSIEISTVDGFQGQEREVIIFSCVRTGEGRGIGFLNDTRRLNVALTRAQCSLFVLGKAQSLSRNPIWRAMIDDAKARNCYLEDSPKLWSGVEGRRTLDNLLPSKKQAIDLKPNNNIPNGPSLVKTPAQRRMESQGFCSSLQRGQTSSSTLNRHPAASHQVASSNRSTGQIQRILIDDLLDRDK